MHLETKFYSAGLPLRATIFLPDKGNENILAREVERFPEDAAVATTKYPAIVICHGSYRDRNDGLDRFAEVLGEYGLVSLRFDIRGHGVDSPTRYRLLPSSEMPYDVFNAINYLESLPFIDRGRIGITGISLGGALAVQMPAMDKRIRSSVPMASPAGSRHDTQKRWGDRTDAIMEMLYEDARVNAATGISRIINRESLRAAGAGAASAIGVVDELLFPGNSAYATLESVRDMMNLNPLDYAPEIRCPILIMHGAADKAIPCACARKLYDAIPEDVRKEIRLYEGVEHNMPRDKQREKIFADAAKWFQETLQQSI